MLRCIVAGILIYYGNVQIQIDSAASGTCSSFFEACLILLVIYHGLDCIGYTHEGYTAQNLGYAMFGEREVIST